MTDPKPIDTSPHDQEIPLLLFCRDQGGWQVGIWYDGMWMDYLTLAEELQPSHWLPLPPDPPGADG